MNHKEKKQCQILIRADPIRNGNCKYHVVFVPKRRRKAIFGQTRRQLGAIFHALARHKECQIIEVRRAPRPIRLECDKGRHHTFCTRQDDPDSAVVIH